MAQNTGNSADTRDARASSAQPEAESPSDQFVTGVIDSGPLTGIQLTVVGLCLLFNMLDGFDITAMAVVAGAVSEELSLTADRLGWIFSFALAGMMMGAMFLAPLSDLFGRRRMIIVSILLVGVSIVLTSYATTLWEFIVLRFVSGLGAGAMLASQAALAAEYSPTKYRAAAVALVTSGYPLGAMMTSVVAGWILPEHGWRGMFWFGGVATIGMVGVALLLIPESVKYLVERRPAGALESVNRIFARMSRPPVDALPSVPAVSQASSYKFELLGATYRSTTLTLWTAFFLCFSTLYFLMSWIPRLMEQAGFDASTGRDAFFLFNLGGVLGIYLMSWMSTRWELTNVICALSLLSSVAMIVFAAWPGELTLMMVLILLIGILQQGGFTGLYSTAAKVYPTRVRSTGIGWAIGLGRLGAVAGPAIAGYLIAAGFDMSHNFYFFAVPMAIGGLIAYRLHVR